MGDLFSDRWKLIQRLSLLAYVHRGDDSKDLYKAIIVAKILKGFYDDCNRQDQVDAARDEAILAIVKYVKDHPRATEKELQREVEKQIALFVEKIK
ncbi:uncharacterized protein LOC129961720 [Argiope bruennichi]|uniref:uncharacterized protein LOC129961720 n=1 Tax=Argiope bruennichi TaxID=94029 RepID=UPI0024957BCC|nr:uncharacterized protein LOC129961720 [Argiope bruennichi]XP_055931241.1 uncharacterized protein LOC129961720 [Argiope bruennichi]XP_055931242.1 uncharacterized protein LOC129961720 [Argiope bruennichi]XP_055931243.1 uncharacterized protein LOC129961720 [Argiope bruennichi]XP_055931246.1 uncharacterized protein LOC129961720 [Argiope bruennichi]XP_055931247.1 uncharacterized protein LOC129961720 [Argiope bruennichi]XP_055931248.1 uncharacterized protein LOC129961720 [Argiope bruennichi]